MSYDHWQDLEDLAWPRAHAASPRVEDRWLTRTPGTLIDPYLFLHGALDDEEMAPSRARPHQPNIDPRWASPPSAAEMLMRSRPDLYPYVPAGLSGEGSSAGVESPSAFDSALGLGDAGSFPGGFWFNDRNPIGGDWHNRDRVSAPLGLLPQGFEARFAASEIGRNSRPSGGRSACTLGASGAEAAPLAMGALRARSFLEAQENFINGRSAEGKPFSEMPLFAAPWEDSRFTELGKLAARPGSWAEGQGPSQVDSSS